MLWQQHSLRVHGPGSDDGAASPVAIVLTLPLVAPHPQSPASNRAMASLAEATEKLSVADGEAAPVSPEDAEAVRRAEIMARLAAARQAKADAEAAAALAVEKREAAAKLLDYAKYGTHRGITCDGCMCAPLVGWRFKCRSCPNHDICEECHEMFLDGTLRGNPEMLRKNRISQKVEDHSFVPHAEKAGPQFARIAVAGKTVEDAPPAEKKKKIKANVSSGNRSARPRNAGGDGSEKTAARRRQATERRRRQGRRRQQRRRTDSDGVRETATAATVTDPPAALSTIR